MIVLRTSIRAAAAILALASGVAVAQTEQLYVIEQLTVSVNATADGSGDRVGQIKSGDRVEVLEHSGDQARVKIPTGEEGWVRSSYLSASKPLREQLKASTEELNDLRQEKSKLEADLAAARKAASAASAAANASAASTPTVAAAAPPSIPPSAATAADSNVQAESAGESISSNPPLFADTGLLPSRPSWIFALVVAVLALAGGFALGWRMLDRRIRAKYGGLRIY